MWSKAYENFVYAWILFYLITKQMKDLQRAIILQLSYLPTLGKGLKKKIKEPGDGYIVRFLSLDLPFP